MAGSDLTNETEKTIKAIKLLNRPDIKVNVVVGAGNKNKETIKRLCEQSSQFTFYCQVDNMAELMNEADLAIGAGGTTIWERYFMELPSIVISVAHNQIKICEDCATEGLLKYLGKFSDVKIQDITNTLKEFIK